MRSSAPCSSAKTVVAPTSMVTTPTTVAQTLSAGSRALASRASMVAAASAPTRPASSFIRWPWAASRPSTRPATDTTMSSSGAIEKKV